VAVFDTAFHQTMPKHAYLYPLPMKFYEQDHVRRYGFHGTSHRFVSRRVCEMLGTDWQDKKIICCHIGNGASISAIKNGKSIDTSMGLTPTEGLMMGTRCGDVDPGALVFLMEKYNLTSKDLMRIINKESGVLGITGISSDMREICDEIDKGNPIAQLAMDMYELRILKYIGAYAAELGGVDIIAFTGGVGENQTPTRRNICRSLEFLGVKIDEQLNDKLWRGKEGEISTPDSKVKVVVVMTDEEYMIARDTEAIIEGREP
jgi:acetate kinase